LLVLSLGKIWFELIVLALTVKPMLYPVDRSPQ